MVVTYNKALFLGQWQGEFVRLRKLHDRLRAIQQGVTRAARTPSAATVRQRVARALATAGPQLRDHDRDRGPGRAHARLDD